MSLRPLLATLVALIPLASHAAEPDPAREVLQVLQKHCVRCHGAQKSQASLRLDSLRGIREGGDGGPAVTPKMSKASRLMRAVRGDDPEIARMPPKGSLSDAEVRTLAAWIDAGAPGEDAAPAPEGAPRPGSSHWAFQPVKRPAAPAVANPGWVRNPIDAFILARLEREGLAPSPEADRATLIRRVHLDVLGLLPNPEQAERFVQSTAPDAYERMVEEALASPHHGERWGRHWLDAARYADSHGYSIDAPRSIWKYRDWVIDAVNRDQPFDQFAVEQLAGDLLPQATVSQKIATGFHRNTMINQEGGINLEQFRVESVIDRVNTTGSVFLGLTVGCAQCHDHKYDPISQREYYQLFAFFNNADEPTLEVATPEQARLRSQVRAELQRVEAALRQLDPTTPERVERWERSITDATRPQLSRVVAQLFDVAPNGRSARQKQQLEDAYRGNDEARHTVGGLLLPLGPALHLKLLGERRELARTRARLKREEPAIATSLVMQERGTPRDTRVLLGGDFLRPGVPVKPGTPAVLPPLPASERASRLDLARWLVAPENPLTRRVIVNRFWAAYFGTGLVETDNDFGTQGTPPTHPELLDYLAGEFQASGGSMKAMHRLILTSSTYRQSSRTRGDLLERDARNRLLARQNRLRVEAEVIRDVALCASGLLTPTIGGPSVFPPQPQGVYRFTQIDKAWTASLGADRFRRGMYTHLWRSAPHPALTVFDLPDASTSCTRRGRSNTPLQALTILNDRGFHEYAQALARRLQGLPVEGDTPRIEAAFRICFAREATAREVGRVRQLFDSQAARFAAEPAEAMALLETKQADADLPRRAAWVMVARVLLNLDELITRE